jgi:hypothetical protein
MSDKQSFECENCGGTQEQDADGATPECCGKPMKKAEPLPVCETSATAEHSRPDDFGEPCDDGRAGS